MIQVTSAQHISNGFIRLCLVNIYNLHLTLNTEMVFSQVKS